MQYGMRARGAVSAQLPPVQRQPWSGVQQGLPLEPTQAEAAGISASAFVRLLVVRALRQDAGDL